MVLTKTCVIRTSSVFDPLEGYKITQVLNVDAQISPCHCHLKGYEIIQVLKRLKLKRGNKLWF